MSGGDGRLRRVRLAFERNYTQIPNDWLRNPQLSMKARCLLGILMSHDEGYVVTLKTLAATNQEGISAIRSAVDELRRHDFLEIEQLRDRRTGRLSGSVWVLTDPAEVADRRRAQPQLLPDDDHPRSDSPRADNPHADNRTSKEAHPEEDLHPGLPTGTSTRAGAKEDALTGDSLSDAIWERCPVTKREHVFDGDDPLAWCGRCAQVRADGSVYDRHGRQMREAQAVEA